MNESRRRFIKMLPVAAVAAGTITIAGVEGKVVEISPAKRYVVKVPAYLAQEDVNRVQVALKQRGFPDMLVVSGDVELFEIQ